LALDTQKKEYVLYGNNAKQKDKVKTVRQNIKSQRHKKLQQMIVTEVRVYQKANKWY